jgi:hypothetical protein
MDFFLEACLQLVRSQGSYETNKEVIGIFGYDSLILSRPANPDISRSARTCITSPPILWIRSIAAEMVPPVARTSSISRTLAPGMKASL